MLHRASTPCTVRSQRRAFTLLEILIVVAIIVILAGVGVVYLMPQLTKSEEKLAKTKAQNLSQAVEAYKIDNGQYPSDVMVLTQPAEALNGKPYISEEGALDPWGKPYQIDPNGSRNKGAKADVFTVSPDGKTIGNF
jgi:general secretion pathway protein G